jgi:hypothetical protein
MSQKLAIKGHETRGKEVIELLEMLGGKNCFHLHGLFSEHAYYFIGGPRNDEIRAGEYMFDEYAVLQMIDDMCFFTLEEFLEKYPYKVGDKVYIKVDPNENCLGYDKIYGEIESAMWVEKFGYVVYKLKDYSGIFYREDLHPYKEEVSMEDNKLSGTVDNSAETKSCTVSLKAIDNSIDASQFMQLGKIFAVCFNTENYENEVELKLGDYEIVVRDGKTYAVLKKSKYPTTYAECCEVLVGRKPKPNEISFDKMEFCLVDLDNTQSIDFQTPYLSQLNSLFRLRICCDAYWKIYGEEMGLGKPWKPDWDNLSTNHEFIEIKKGCFTYSSRVLVFPIAEMRDAFYENFKDLIECCKELL